MTPEERAAKFGLNEAMTALIAALIREAVEQDRADHNNRVAHVVKKIRAAALEEAAKVAETEGIIGCFVSDKIRALKEMK